MTRPRDGSQARSDEGTARADRSERTETDQDPDTSPARQAAANQERAFESGEENPT